MKKQIAQALVTLAMATTSMTAKANHQLYCYEDSGERGALEVLVGEDDGGRLMAQVFAQGESRLLKQAGVTKREQSGRDYDIVYIGRDLKVQYSSEYNQALLETKLNGRSVRAYMTCD